VRGRRGCRVQPWCLSKGKDRLRGLGLRRMRGGRKQWSLAPTPLFGHGHWFTTALVSRFLFIVTPQNIFTLHRHNKHSLFVQCGPKCPSSLASIFPQGRTDKMQVMTDSHASHRLPLATGLQPNHLHFSEKYCSNSNTARACTICKFRSQEACTFKATRVHRISKKQHAV
jgi:hypothetical protein